MKTIDLWNFIVKKPIVWVLEHVEGAHVKQQVEQELDALKPQVENALSELVGAKAAAIVTSSDITETMVYQAIAPEANALAAQAVSKVTQNPTYVAQLNSYAVATIADVTQAAYNALVAVNK